MFAYDSHPADGRQGLSWVPAGTPRAIDADGTVVLMMGREDGRTSFLLALPGVIESCDLDVESDADTASLYVGLGWVSLSVPQAGDNGMWRFSEVGKPLQARVREVFARAVAGWPELGWSGHRCVFNG